VGVGSGVAVGGAVAVAVASGVGVSVGVIVAVGVLVTVGLQADATTGKMNTRNTKAFSLDKYDISSLLPIAAA
jgi:hypothetical protein